MKTPCDKQGEDLWNWLLLSAIGICIVIAVLGLGGCASMPGPMPALPAVQGFAAQPNCVWFCTVHVTIAKAESDIQSDGTAPVTAGDQTIDLDSTSSTQKSTSVDPN